MAQKSFRHAAEQCAPLDTKDLYESILDGLTCGIWVANEHDLIYYANKGMEMIAGVTKQKLRGYRVLEDSSESTIDYFRQHYREAKETLRPVYYSEVPVLTPAGRQTYQSGWLIPIVRDGSYLGMICILEDITNEKEVRKALRESEARYGQLVENVNSIIMRLDLEGNITFLNEFGQRFFGFRQDEIICTSVVGTIVPKTDRSEREIRSMLKNIGRQPLRYANLEHKNVRRDGGEVWIGWTNKAIYDETGRVTEILCVGNDITERKQNESLLKKCRTHLEKTVRKRTAELKKANEELKQEIKERQWAEEILRSSEKKYRLVAENANEGIVISQDGFLRYVNPKAEKITGYSEKELAARPFIEFIHPGDRDFMMERYLRRLRGDNMPNVYSCRIIDKEGTIKWVEINTVLITWMGRPATLTFFNNVTERRNTLGRLRLLESAIQQANDSIVITTAGLNTSGSKVVFVNQAFTKMTGYTPEEVVQNPSVVQQGTITERSELDEGDAFRLETTTFHRDGTQFNLEWQIAPIRNDGGKVTHFIIIQRDITERKQAEEEVKAYQAQLRSLASELSLAEERERRRIATDLHDHIGQALAITKLKLGALRDALTSDGHGELLSDIWALLDQTIRYTKSLTFELSPPILYELGFEATIEWLCEQMQKQYGILFTCENDGAVKPLDKDVSILMFQAIRELFMNVVKHAHATKTEVFIKRTGDNMEITVKDDGLGFHASGIEKNTFGFFSIRERLKHFGGTFVIETSPGAGTLVALTAPVRTEQVAGVTK
ncbi:MAG: PAS domain S-box protein [Nitrospirae bacterium]|nr:PAS domain S-box protein [Nitrospirota bacterium]